MNQRTTNTRHLLSMIREGQALNFGQQVNLTFQLSLPAIMAQLSSIVMQYIDASMVGRLGAPEAASIGLVSTSIWLMSGTCSAACTGFSVQVAHYIGAGDNAQARHVLRQSLIAIAVFAMIMTFIGCSVSSSLPGWLGGDESIRDNASAYFLIFSTAIPFILLNSLAGSMLRCSGNMKAPSLLNMLMCVLDVIFNFFLIFPSRQIQLGDQFFSIPGAGLGVSGAAYGTAFAMGIIALTMTVYLIFFSPELKLTQDAGSYRPTANCLKRALHISLPMGVEHIVMCTAQVLSTIIVAPLGVFSIAANSFAITAESLCYMPGYGIADAATTLVGQCVGARRHELCKRFAWITVGMGMIVMTLMGIIMYMAAPLMMEIMTPVQDIQHLGSMALRIEAFAEPMFAASIVAYGAFVGAGDTLIPAIMNLGSIWAVRLTLAALLAPVWGLQGVWTAMCIELCFRGLIFLYRLYKGNWMKGNQLPKITL